MQYSVLIKIAIDPQCGLHCSGSDYDTGHGGRGQLSSSAGDNTWCGARGPLTSDTNQGGHLACYKSTADTNLINSENIHPILLAGTLPLVMSPCALVTTIQWLHPAPNIDIPPGQAAWALSCRHLLQMPKVRNLTTATPKYSDIHNWFSDTILLLYLTLTQSKYSLLLQYVCCERSPSLNFLTTVSSWPFDKFFFIFKAMQKYKQ